MTCLACNADTKAYFSINELLSFRPHQNDAYCASCLTSLVWLKDDTTCSYCGRLMEQAGVCGDCLNWRQHYPDETAIHTALVAYDGMFPDWLYRIKTLGDVRGLSLFRKELKSYYQSLIKDGPVRIVPIPSSPKRLKQRGFNLVEALLEDAGIPYCHLLDSQADGQKQSEKTRLERVAMQNPFVISKNVVDKIENDENSRIILVDDVYTTGTTLRNARKTLLLSGFENEKSFSLAR